MRPGTAAALVVACLAIVECAAPPRLATEDDVTRLERSALAGDRGSIRALFELRTDGVATDESVDTAVGNTIRRCPTIFLQELQRSEREYLDGILGNLGPELVDDFDAQRREMRLRVAALQTVDSLELGQLRDRCVALLQRWIDD